MRFFLSFCHSKTVVTLLIILVFSDLAVTEKEADTKKERKTREDEVKEVKEEKGTGKEAETGKEAKEEEAAIDYTEKKKDDDRVQGAKKKKATETTGPTEEIEDPAQEVTEKTKEAKEETATESTEINDERDERLRELTEEELEAVLKKNCSLVNLDDDDGSSGPEVAEYPCEVALWFQGELPKWIKTFNFVKDVEALSQKELDEAAKAVCECKVIDIGDFCRARVRVTAQKIIDRCPRNSVVTRIFRQEESHFGPHVDLYDV